MNTWSYRARLRLEHGGYEWFEVNAEPERQPDGGTLWYGQFHNIQHYKNLEQSLRESEAEFSFQAGFQRLIARLSTEFINLGFGTIDQCIDELLRSIGTFFKVDRAYLYCFSDDYSVMTNTHEWCRDGVPAGWCLLKMSTDCPGKLLPSGHCFRSRGCRRCSACLSGYADG